MIGTADGKQYEDGFDYLVQSRGLDKQSLSDQAVMDKQAKESLDISKAVRPFESDEAGTKLLTESMKASGLQRRMQNQKNLSSDISDAVRNWHIPAEPEGRTQEDLDIHFERLNHFLNAIVDPKKFDEAMKKYPAYNPNVHDTRDAIGIVIDNFLTNPTGLPPQEIRKTTILSGKDKPIIDVGPAPGGPGGGYTKPANENIRPGLDPYDKAVAGQKLEQTGKKIEGPLPEARPAVKQLEINPADYKKAINPGDLKSVSPPEGYYDKIEATRFGGTGISHPGYRHEVYDRETGDKIGTFSSSFRAARKIADTEEGSSRYQQIMVKANRLTPKETKFLKDNNLYEEYTNGPKPIKNNPARRLLEDPEMMKKFEEFLKQIKGYPKPE